MYILSFASLFRREGALDKLSFSSILLNNLFNKREEKKKSGEKLKPGQKKHIGNFYQILVLAFLLTLQDDKKTPEFDFAFSNLMVAIVMSSSLLGVIVLSDRVTCH